MLLAVTTDLMSAAPIEHAARQAGTTCRVLSPDQWDRLEASDEVQLVVLDLTAVPQVADTVGLLRGKCGDAVPIVAFGPHVQVEKLSAARQAGCTRVLPRGQFYQSAAAIIAEFVAPRA